MFQRNTEPGQSRLATPSWAPPSAAGQGGSPTCGPWDDLPRPCGVQLIPRPGHGLASRSDVMVTATRSVPNARSCRIAGVPGSHRHPRLCITERWACASRRTCGAFAETRPEDRPHTRVRSRHNTAVSLRWPQLGVSHMRLAGVFTGRDAPMDVKAVKRCWAVCLVLPSTRWSRDGGPEGGPRRGSSLGSAVSDGRAYSCGVVGGTFPGVEVSAAGRLDP